MRRLNTILSVVLLVLILIHGILGSLKLLNVSATAGKVLAWTAVGVLAIHTALGVILTIQTFRASKKKGENYLKQNALFWTRRASGVAILIMLFFHIGAFGHVDYGHYILFEFTTVKLISHILLIASLFVHIFVNIRPMLVSLGVIKHKERRGDIFLILSILLLFFSAAIVIYYVGWQSG